MTFIEILPLAILGAVVGLDVVSFPQAMISRPLVAATLGGALVGRPMDGLLAGAVLELVALETQPFGASRYPEWGSASVVGGALYGMHAANSAGALVVSVLAAIAVGAIGGMSMVALRRLNASWARSGRSGIEAGSYRSVIGLQLAGLTADLARGFMITAGALLLLGPLAAWMLGRWGADARLSHGVVLALVGAVAAGAVWKLFHAAPRAPLLFAAGLIVGVLLLGVT